MTDRSRLFLVPLLLLCLQVPAAKSGDEPGVACQKLCGNWALDAAASDPVEPALDAAFARFKDPKPERMHRGNFDNLESLSREADEVSLGPIMARPPRARLREELVETLRTPKTLLLGANDDDVLIGSDGHTPRRLTPGEPSARVDAQGTAKIRCEWRQGRFVISESYGRRNDSSETYALQGDALIVTRVVKRQGLPELKLKSVYRKT
jgi:hypothetical protein